MVIVEDSTPILKRFLSQTGLKVVGRTMVLRMALSFILHRGRMSCSAAGGAVASQAVHRGQVTRFLARKRWQQKDLNDPLRRALLQRESGRGRFVFLIDATMVSQAGKKTENTYSTGNRQRRPRKGRRYNQKKVVRKNVHSFTFGLLLTPSGIRVPFEIPHYTPEYCQKTGRKHLTTAEAAARLVRELPLPEEADVVVIGDTAYDAKVLRQACDERHYLWIFPVNPERVYAGKAGQRPKVRSRLKDWKTLSLQTIRLHASAGKYARLRRASQWRMGPKAKPSVFYTHQERQDVHKVGHVQLVFSTKKQHLTAATPDDVKILMSNATSMSSRELIELYALRWQIELFFKELKSTLGFAQYRFQSFRAVEGWVKTALASVLFLEFLRASRLADKRLTPETRSWWERQRLYGLCTAFRQECTDRELTYLSERLQTPGGIAKLKRVLRAATPKEYRCGI
jgi:hypothetical protein